MTALYESPTGTTPSPAPVSQRLRLATGVITRLRPNGRVPRPPASQSADPPSPLAANGWLALSVNILTVVAVLIVLLAGYLFGLSRLLEQRSQRLLGESLAKEPGHAAFAGRLPAEGQPVAVLSIPAIGLHAFVVEGVTSGDLEKGPGLLPGSAPPGTGGDTVIEGRRAAFGAPFGSVPRVRVGDTIQVVGALGSFRYVVTGSGRLTTGATDPIGVAPGGAVTLVTSSPAYLPSRPLVVSARLVGSPVAADNVAPPPDATLGLSGDPAAGFGAFVSLQALIIGAVWLWRRRRRGRLPLMAWVLAAPITLALLLILFSETAKLLPATL